MTSVGHSEAINNTSAFDTSTDVPMSNSDEKQINGVDEESTGAENKTGKRKRSTKKSVEQTENYPNERPKRTLSKREEIPINMVNGNAQMNKVHTKQETANSIDEEEREKSMPILYDVADVVWVKMSGHPWWPSLVIRDPSDSDQCFTKISGNTRAKRMYFVVFYGSTADFAWIPDAAIIPYKGVEEFIKYAQETVDRAQTKGQKEQLTERFQLKITISRRDDWEMAVREADEAIKETNEKRLQDIQPKVEFYTKRFVASKGQTGRRSKASIMKPEVLPKPVETSITESNNRSSLADKTFEFKSEDEDSSTTAPIRKTSTVKIKLSKKTSDDSDSNPTPPTKRSYINKTQSEDQSNSISVTTVFGQTANGSSVSYQQRAPVDNNNGTSSVKSNPTNMSNSTSSGKKRGRPPSKPKTPLLSPEDTPMPEFNSTSPSVTTKFTTQRKPIIKPQAFMNLFSGQHDIRTGFLSPFEEQEVLDALEQLGPTKTFEEAEQKAKRRFEHILCLNLNRTHVDIPQEWFYTFLFSHPSLIVKNPQWFAEKHASDTLNDNDLLNDVQSSSSLAVLKHQLVVLSKLYRNELQIRQSAPVKQRRSTGGSIEKRKSVEKKHNINGDHVDMHGNEQHEKELVN